MPRSLDTVPVAPIRQAFLDSGIEARVVTERLGWPAKDTSRLRRALGLMKHSTKSYHQGHLATEIDYDKAVAICRALHLAPRELDL